jgi:glyoxylase-like metal-dependent hydrolase (beta-lactamase superfamily II)
MNGIFAGRYRCFTLETGTMTFDGSSMFQSAPPEAWRRHFQVEDDGTMLFAVRSLLLRSRASTVLVDTGWGDTLPLALAEAYGVDCSLHSLQGSLATLGVDPGSVTHVLLTHLHVDHLGGVTVRRNGELHLAFPRATHLVQRTQLEAALRPRPREEDSFIAEEVALLAGSDRLQLLEGPGEFLPGLEVGVADGHTAGQQFVVVHDDRRPLLFPADVIPTAAHVPFPWFTAFDMDARLAVREKKLLLKRAALENHLVVFDHEPRFAACTVEREGRSFSVAEKVAAL